MKTITNRLAIALGTTFLVAACGGAPTADEVRRQTSNTLSTAITEVTDAVDQAANHRGFDALVALFKDLGGDRLLAVDVGRPPAVPGQPAPPPLPSKDWSSELDTAKWKREGAKIAQELDALLAKYIFNEANVERRSGSTTTFLLGASALCGDSSRSPSPMPPPDAPPPLPRETQPPGPVPPPPPADSRRSNSCADSLQKLPIRIDASFASDGMDLGVRVGTSSTLLVIELRSGRITVKAMLSALSPMIAELARLTGARASDMPTALKGTLAVSLIRKAKGDYRAEVAIAEAVVFEMPTGAGQLRIDLPVSQPLIAVGLNKTALSFLLKSAGGALSLPAEQLFGRSAKTQTPQPLSIVLPQMELGLDADSAGKVTITQVNLGASALKMLMGQTTLASFEIDRAAKSPLHIELSDVAGRRRLSFDSTIGLKAELALAKLDAYMRDPAPAWANERYRAELQGQKPTIAIRDGNPALFEILEGTLSVETKLRPQKLVAPANSCLFWQDQKSERLLDSLSSGTCP